MRSSLLLAFLLAVVFVSGTILLLKTTSFIPLLTRYLLEGTNAAWTWSEPTTLEYVYYSYATYCDTGTISNWTCKWCQEPQLSAFVPTAFPTAPLISGYGFVGYHPINQTSKQQNLSKKEMEKFLTFIFQK